MVISNQLISWSNQIVRTVLLGENMTPVAGQKGLLGNTIVVDHGHGMVTLYGHIDKLLKKRGEKVSRLETIALMGNTGRSTGPHVHYEVRLNGIPVNPEKYIIN